MPFRCFNFCSWLHVTAITHNVFHVSLLALSRKTLYQVQNNYQPPAVLVDDQEEYEVKRILDVRKRRERGKGGSIRKEYLVKWTGYREPTGEPGSNFDDTVVLECFHHKIKIDQEARYPTCTNPNRLSSTSVIQIRTSITSAFP